jgi:Glycine zipper
MKSSNGTMPRVAIFAAATLAVVLSGCVVPPPPRPVPPPPPPVQTNIYAYPSNGQTAEQQDRDRYDCYQWAIQQTGFDPSSPSIPPHERIQVVSGPPAVVPGSGVAAGAVTGAVLGAIVSRPRDAGAGALVGAVLGGVLGGAAESAQNQQAAQANTRVVERQQSVQLERKAADFRRAAGACLEARGYSVR